MGEEAETESRKIICVRTGLGLREAFLYPNYFVMFIHEYTWAGLFLVVSVYRGSCNVVSITKEYVVQRSRDNSDSGNVSDKGSTSIPSCPRYRQLSGSRLSAAVQGHLLVACRVPA